MVYDMLGNVSRSRSVPPEHGIYLRATLVHTTSDSGTNGMEGRAEIVAGQPYLGTLPTSEAETGVYIVKSLELSLVVVDAALGF